MKMEKPVLKADKHLIPRNPINFRKIIVIVAIFMVARFWAEIERAYAGEPSFALQSISNIEYYVSLIIFASPALILFIFDHKTFPLDRRRRREVYGWMFTNILFGGAPYWYRKFFRKLVWITVGFPLFYFFIMLLFIVWPDLFNLPGLRTITDEINYVWFSKTYAALRQAAPEEAYTTMPIYLMSLIFLGIYGALLARFIWRHWEFYQDHVYEYEFPAKASFPKITAALGLIYFLPTMLYLILFYPWLVAINISSNAFLAFDIAIIMWASEGFVNIFLYLFLKHRNP